MQPEERDTTKLDRVLKNEEQRKENRHRQQCREASRQSGKRAHASVIVDFHDRFSLLHRIFVLLLCRGKLRLQLLHLQTRSHHALV